jgi:hypothetical protein
MASIASLRLLLKVRIGDADLRRPGGGLCKAVQIGTRDVQARLEVARAFFESKGPQERHAAGEVLSRLR